MQRLVLLATLLSSSAWATDAQFCHNFPNYVWCSKIPKDASFCHVEFSEADSRVYADFSCDGKKLVPNMNFDGGDREKFSELVSGALNFFKIKRLYPISCSASYLDGKRKQSCTLMKQVSSLK